VGTSTSETRKIAATPSTGSTVVVATVPAAGLIETGPAGRSFRFGTGISKNLQHQKKKKLNAMCGGGTQHIQ
jgi:hypothetical protein